jgi:hypothetical protein
MKACQYCGYTNREGFFFCEDCGQPIGKPDATENSTQKIDDSLEHYEWRTSYGTAHFHPGALILLHLADYPTPITVHPADIVIIGRKDADTRVTPDIDLAPYGALEKGVSRTHAALLRSEEALLIMDAGSSNGTHLNGQRLVPQQPRVLRDGDEIRFGRLVAHIYFKA